MTIICSSNYINGYVTPTIASPLQHGEAQLYGDSKSSECDTIPTLPIIGEVPSSIEPAYPCLPRLIEVIRHLAEINKEIKRYLDIFEPKGILHSESECSIFIYNMQILYPETNQYASNHIPETI